MDVTGLTAVVPCYNEGQQVQRAYAGIVDALSDVDLEILFVDDGSTDDTLAVIKELAEADDRVRYLSFTKNSGPEAVHAAAFRYASKPWTLQLDADLQFPPSEARRLLTKAAEGYDVVFGVRAERHDPLVRRWGSPLAQWVARRLFGVEVPRNASTFRVMRTPVARTLVQLGLGTPYFIAMVPLIGARYACVPTEHRQREGRSKFRIAWLVGHAFDLWFGYSWRPLNGLYLVAALGVPLTLLAGVLTAAGWLPLAWAVAVGLGFGAATLASVALLARYLYRLSLDQRRTRPFYVREANIPVRPEDSIDGGQPWVPPPGRIPADDSSRQPAGLR